MLKKLYSENRFVSSEDVKKMYIATTFPIEHQTIITRKISPKNLGKIYSYKVKPHIVIKISSLCHGNYFILNNISFFRRKVQSASE